MEEILKVWELVKYYRNVRALNGLSFTVNRGEIFGLLGPNGSGKSTTLRILVSLVHPDSGYVQMFGMKDPVNRDSSLRKRIGALIERPDFYNYLTAFQNLRLLANISGNKITCESIRQKLDWVGLNEFADRKVRIFSHGMKQRLGIAQALINDPEFLILDEPANGLDPHGIIDIRNIILKLRWEKGITIMLSSHILREVELIADRMVVMHRGAAVAEGNVTDLLSGKNPLLRLSVDNTELAIQILKSNGISDIQVDENGELIVRPLLISPGMMNKFLVTGGIEVKSLVAVRSLEDYYLQITGNVPESHIH
ncbi:MAG TPA: ABC transporter ATP-binding protein [Cyclobacteriaceae bacterium]|nr:ABC transporter ATP-binding protein [Cyclobacteriaceae bacterium]